MSLEIPETWTFKSDNVAKNFDSHVREQLPWYDIVSDAVACIARNYIPKGGRVYDFGCSTGNIGKRLDAFLTTQNAELIGIDNSEAMADKYTAGGQFICADLESFEPEPFDVAICFLTIMFMKPEDQIEFYNRLLSKMRRGGCIICVDKQFSSSGYPASVIWRMTQDAKLKQGATLEEIAKKEMSLIGQQRPVNPAIVADGVKFFQFGDFVGWFKEWNQ